MKPQKYIPRLHSLGMWPELHLNKQTAFFLKNFPIFRHWQVFKSQCQNVWTNKIPIKKLTGHMCNLLMLIFAHAYYVRWMMFQFLEKITSLEKRTLGTYYLGNAIYPPVVSTSLGCCFFFAYYTEAASIIWILKLEYASPNVLRKTEKKKCKMTKICLT